MLSIFSKRSTASLYVSRERSQSIGFWWGAFGETPMLRQARSALVLFRFRYKEERLLRGRTHALLDELVRGAAKPPLQLPAYARVYEVLPRGYVLRLGAAGESLRYVDCIVCVHVTLRVLEVSKVLLFMRVFRGCFRVCCLLTCGRSP